VPFPGTSQVQLAFYGGLNSKTAKFSLDQPNLEDAENCRYTVAGQVQKRPAFTALSRNVQGGGFISAGAGIQVFNNELVMFDGRKVYSWDPDENVWASRGSAYSIAAEQVRVINTKIASQSNPDAATAGNAVDEGLTLYVWEDNRTEPVAGSGVRYSVVDNTTGGFVVSDALLWASGGRPKVIPWQSSAPSDSWLVAYQISDSNIYGNTVQSDRPNLLSPVFPIATDGLPNTPGATTIAYDLSSVTVGTDDNAHVYFAYRSFAGLRFLVLAPSPGATPAVLANAIVVGGDNTIQVVAVASAGPDIVWVVWSDIGSTYARPYTTAGAPLSAGLLIQSQPSVNIALVASPPFTGAISVTCEIANATTGGNYLNSYLVTVNGFTYVGQQRGLGLASKAFTRGKDTFVNAVWPSALQATYFTLCLTSPVGVGANSVSGLPGSVGFEAVCKYGDQNGGGYRTNKLLSECLPYASPVSFLFAGQRKGAFTSFETSQGAVLGAAGYSATFATNNEFNCVASNNNLHITGGVKKIYDGVTVVEDNFNYFPELLSLPATAEFPAVPNGGAVVFPNQAPSQANPAFSGQGCSVFFTSGGGLTAASQYQYCITYEWTDNYGQVQRSHPSVPTIVSTGESDLTANLTIPTLRLTDKDGIRSPVSICVYRTQANLPIFFKVTDDNAPLVNDPSVDFAFFVDATPDGPPTNFAGPGISANENLYTGSQLANTAPPACSLISLFQNRIVVNESGDPNVVWYSQNKFDLSQYNTLPLDWNTSFVEGIDSRGGGGVTGIGLLDASLAIFKPTSIFILSGSGPNALDTSGAFSDAQLLVSDTGCTNQNSLSFVTQTPNASGGLLFKSAKGIYLLGRDQSLTYIGAPVEEYNYLTITSSEILALTNEIVFSTLEGTALVYNYYFNAWTTWTGLPAVDSCVWQNALVMLTAEGTALVQDLTGAVWEDTLSVGPTAPIVQQFSRSVTTPWIKLGGQLQGYQAVYNALILGQFQGDSILQVDVAYDYNPAVVESCLINSNIASAAAWGGLPIWGYPVGQWGNVTFSNYQFCVNFMRPRCQAIRLTLTDMTPEATAGSTLNGVALEVLALPGGMRMPTGNLIASTGKRF
jgi:hypothetical protein